VQNTIAIAAHHIALAIAAGCRYCAEHSDEDRASGGEK
jgi:acyl-CoA reductase-like NAD-dependent aldehyde dehydrogenase